MDKYKNGTSLIGCLGRHLTQLTLNSCPFRGRVTWALALRTTLAVRTTMIPSHSRPARHSCDPSQTEQAAAAAAVTMAPLRAASRWQPPQRLLLGCACTATRAVDR